MTWTSDRARGGGEALRAFTKKHYDRILENWKMDEDAPAGAIEAIVHLNPRPGNTSQETARPVQTVVPTSVERRGRRPDLQLNGRNAPELRLSRTYKDMLQEYARNKKDKDSTRGPAVHQAETDSAKWFIDAIRQRQHTLLMTMEAIMEHQRDFFPDGDETRMRPTILKDIAEKVGWTSAPSAGWPTASSCRPTTAPSR